jgi:transcription-repair coupling factor (superfamily II helicase)
MNVLSFPSFLQRITASPSCARVLDAFGQGCFPLEIEGAEGSFGAMLLASLFRRDEGRGNFLAVTPTEREAADLASDLKTLGLPVAIFPWWGAMPYRDLAPLSAVFGDRVRVLGALAGGEGAGGAQERGIVVAPERAFLSPLPPPEYIRGLLITLKPGEQIDT